ncbi:MAG: methylenetetrahydrofolate reductase [Candidatus Caenarcaniphilales bacterium]|nr:methylenetetrahydrofolate reductase [Candidatus Caenarcaniphilales bacterium]
MSLKTDLNSGDFVITAELNPKKSFTCETLIENAKKLKGLVSAINVTDNSGAGVKMTPLVASYLMQQETGIEAIWQITCRDRNRLALQSDILGAAALGLKNILPLRGDDPKQGDYPEVTAAFDILTEDLIKAIKLLESGKDMADKDLKPYNPYEFCVGAAAHPGMPDLETQKETMLRRVGLGTEFFQTQICFDNTQLKNFRDSINDDLAAKTLLGITPIKTLKQANFMNKNIWGVDVPPELLASLENAIEGLDPSSEEAMKRQKQVGLENASEITKLVKEMGFKGIHLMAIGQETVLAEILDYIVP